jgi:riboflavin kinase/FMN adenylyltransferase
MLIRLTDEPVLETVVTLGGFDGAHIGHKILIERAKATKRTVGMMTISGGKEGKSLFTDEEKESIFRALGVDFVLALEFDKIKGLTPEEFILYLEKECDAKAFVCGEDFRFGRGATGSPLTVKEMGRTVFVENILYDGGEKVGATLIKRCLESGEIEKANALLGFEFFLDGEVVKDRGVGRKIGFPTANIFYPETKFPIRKGVYETRVFIDGKEYKGITNYGTRPTFNDELLTTETHLISYTGTLYGKKLRVRFVRRLRDVQRFESEKRLIEQLEKDVKDVEGRL